MNQVVRLLSNSSVCYSPVFDWKYRGKQNKEIVNRFRFVVPSFTFIEFIMSMSLQERQKSDGSRNEWLNRLNIIDSRYLQPEWWNASNVWLRDHWIMIRTDADSGVMGRWKLLMYWIWQFSYDVVWISSQSSRLLLYLVIQTFDDVELLFISRSAIKENPSKVFLLCILWNPLKRTFVVLQRIVHLRYMKLITSISPLVSRVRWWLSLLNCVLNMAVHSELIELAFM